MICLFLCLSKRLSRCIAPLCTQPYLRNTIHYFSISNINICNNNTMIILIVCISFIYYFDHKPLFTCTWLRSGVSPTRIRYRNTADVSTIINGSHINKIFLRSEDFYFHLCSFFFVFVSQNTHLTTGNRK